MVNIRVGIIGYGNLGRGVEIALQAQADMELVAIFSRRGPAGVSPVDAEVKVEYLDAISAYQGRIDVMILCGGSATDLPEQTPAFAKYFNVVDSFDNHSQIPAHYSKVDEVAQAAGTTAVISGGWDPGLFSLQRVLAEAVLPKGATYTFWGKGISQGHSDAVRRVEGVKDAIQYTIPIEEAMDRVRSGSQPELATAEKHLREVYVVAEAGADQAKIEETIVNMPGYFADYHTTVHFIDEATLQAEHQAMPHGGFVIRSGETGAGHQHVYEFSLALDSNPEFTASVLVAIARANVRMHAMGLTGAKTILDIAPAWLSHKDPADLRREDL